MSKEDRPETKNEKRERLALDRAIWDAKDMPPAIGGCTCHCHRTPGVKHTVACCTFVTISIGRYDNERNLFD